MNHQVAYDICKSLLEPIRSQLGTKHRNFPALPSSPFERQQSVDIHMHEYKVQHDKGVIAPGAVYAIATSAEPDHNKSSITAQNFIDKKTRYSYCRQASLAVTLLRSMVCYNTDWFLVNTVTIDKGEKKAFPTSLQLRISEELPYSEYPGKLGDRCMYCPMIRKCCCPHMAKKV